MNYLNLFSFDTWGQIALVFTAAFYLFECYAGYKAIKLLVAVVGFTVGFLIGFFVSAGIFTQNAYVPTAIGILAGIGMAILAFKLYLVGVFIYCGSAAYTAVSHIPVANNQATSVLLLVLCIAAFIIVGVLAVKFSKWFIIAVTAVTGAVNAVNVLKTPIHMLEANMIVRISAIVLLAVTGILVQRVTTRHDR